MASISLSNSASLRQFLCVHPSLPCQPPLSVSAIPMLPQRRRLRLSRPPVKRTFCNVINSVPRRSGTYKVGDFMTTKKDLHVVKTTTPIDEALESLVEKRITGFPVVDDHLNLVGVVSDYDLLAIDSISGGSENDLSLFPNVDSSWKTFNLLQKLLTKTKGKVVGDLMTPDPLAVQETTNLEDAAWLLLETRYHRLPVVDSDGKLIGIITRGDIVRAALKIKRTSTEFHDS